MTSPVPVLELGMNISEYFTTTISPLVVAFSVIVKFSQRFFSSSNFSPAIPCSDVQTRPRSSWRPTGCTPASTRRRTSPAGSRATPSPSWVSSTISTIYTEIFNVISNIFAIFKTFESRTNIKLSRFLSDDVLLFFLFLSSSFSDMRYIWRRNAHNQTPVYF